MGVGGLWCISWCVVRSLMVSKKRWGAVGHVVWQQ